MTRATASSDAAVAVSAESQSRDATSPSRWGNRIGRFGLTATAASEEPSPWSWELEVCTASGADSFASA